MDYKHKEKLTKQIIKYELEKVRNQSIIGGILIIGICAVFLAVLLIMCDFTDSKSWRNIPLAIVFLLSIIAFLGITIYMGYTFFVANKSTTQYSIVTDVYIGMCPKRPLDHSRLSSMPIMFAQNGRFELGYDLIYYCWSKRYRMNGRHILETTALNDTFYLLVSSGKIICIYSKKLFELSEELL